MDITTVFGTVIPGSSPGGWTINKKTQLMCFFVSCYVDDIIEIYIMNEMEKIFEELDVDFSVGVLEGDIKRRCLSFGKNKIEPKKKDYFLLYFLNQLKNPLNVILIFAGILTFSLGEHLDTYVIFSAVLVNIFITIFQESRTNKTFQELNKLKEFDVLVKRDSQKTVVQSEELVVGDIVFLNSGDKVPADMRIFEYSSLFIDESSFTGENLSVEKKDGDLVFSGSIVKKGYAIGIVVAVGENSEFGQILMELDGIKKKPSAIAEKMKKISIFIGLIAVFATFIIIAGGVYSGLPIYSLIVLGVSVAVSAIPEGLGASVSAALSVGMHRLLKKGILVKDLVSTETMASVDTILTDKTGTLTEGNMTLKEVFLNQNLKISRKEFLKYAYLASDAVFDFKNKQFVGDEMDIAIANEVEYGYLNLKCSEIEEGYEVLKILPFSSENMFFAKLVKNRASEKMYIFIKGAPELILEKSDSLSVQENEDFQKILKDNQGANSRFLGFAYVEIKNSDFDLDSCDLSADNLRFIGFISFLDPLKKSVEDVLRTVKEMDLDLIMVTGDSKEVAIAVAQESGLVEQGNDACLEGDDIERMTKEELYSVTRDIKVFARVSPKAKLKLAETFVHHGHRIAMTGDGVNDVLALSQADIGITFANASEAAREAASLILKKNDFTLILLAIDEARNVIKNIRKTVVYLLSSSFSELIVIFGALILGGPMPFLAIHILWANIVEEGLINFAFVFGKNKRDSSSKKFNSKILTKKIKKTMFLLGVFDGVFLLTLYLILWKSGLSEIKIQSLMFLALSLDFIFIAYAITDLNKSILKAKIFANKYLNFSVLAGLALICVAIFVEPVSNLLHLEPFSFIEIVYLMGFALADLVVIEMLKYFIFRKK